jgi:hypothetical protein
MFGRMMVESIVQVDPETDLQTEVAALLKVAEKVEIVRWIEFPTSVLLFLLVPCDPESGAKGFGNNRDGRGTESNGITSPRRFDSLPKVTRT